MSLAQPYILGVSYSHNGAACLLRGSEILVMVQEERLSGVKRARIQHYQNSLAVRYCLAHAGLALEDLDALVVCNFATGTSPPIDLSDGMKPLPRRYLTIPHHLGHAYSVFGASGFDDAAVLIIDGQGGPIAHLPKDERTPLKSATVPGLTIESEVISIYSANAAQISLREKHGGDFIPALGMNRQKTPDPRSLCQFGSLGGMFSAVARLLFRDPMEAGKVMGLAPYGKATLPIDSFFTIDADACFHFNDRLLSSFRDLAPWPQNQELYADLAASTQAALEHAVIFLAERARKLTGKNRLCYAGGVALNSIANELLHTQLGFDDIYIMPAAEDSGPAIGAAYYGLQALTGSLVGRRLIHDCCGHPYPAAQIDDAIVRTPFIEQVPCADPLDAAVERLCAGEIIAWFQGGSELGPRALGQRSILCDARLLDGKARLNERVKHREGFRPFAPAILFEKAQEWFEMPPAFPESATMLRVCRFKDGLAQRVPAAAHVDGTGRVQTVTAAANGSFYHLIKRFYEKTGVPILVNTSFNIAGEPIVETPEDALWCLLGTDIDALFLEGRQLRKASDYESLLQLYPRICANELQLSLPIRDGALAFDIDAQTKATVRCATPYGDTSIVIPAPDLILLQLCDGTRSGSQIVEALLQAQEDVTERWVSRRFCQYRRQHVLTLDRAPNL